MTLALVKADGSAATGLTFSAAAGAESAVQTFHVRYNWGSPGGIIRDVFLQLEVDNGSGTYVISGLPALDLHYMKARVVGGANPSNDPAFPVNYTSDWYDLGTDSVLPIKDLVGNSARYLEVKVRAPMGPGAATTLNNFRLVPRFNEVAFGVAGGLTESGNGIQTGVGDLAVYEFVDAPTLTQNTVPDDYTLLGRRWWVRRGVSLRAVAEDHQYTQVDGAAGTLTVGQAYYVTVSQGAAGGATYTKGTRAAAASATAPAAPALELVVGTVKVRYNAVLTEILTSDITLFCTSGRFRPELSTGLALTIGGGRALLPGAAIRRTSSQQAVLAASVTNRVWLSASGGVIVNASATPPAVGVLLLDTAVTDGSGVTSHTDERDGKYLEPTAAYLTVYTPDQELVPTTIYRDRALRETVSIDAAPYTDTTSQIPADAQALAVEARWITLPAGTSTADIGVVGATTRYAAAMSAAPGTIAPGLQDGSRFYASAAPIRITPDVTPGAADGIVEITIRYREAVVVDDFNGCFGRVMAPWRWNLDRVVASVLEPAGGGAAGYTGFDAWANETSLIASGYGPLIPAASRASTTGFPSVTTGAAGDLLGARITEVTTGGTRASGLSLTFVCFPLVGA